jgi:YggT family protein
MVYLINVINFFVSLITFLIIIKVFLSYFMDPYHPVRLWFDRVINPMLRPIQKIIPPIGGLDISPIILILVVQLLGRLLTSLLSTL